MLGLVVAALSGATSGAAGSITAAWSNLEVDTGFGGSDETSSTVVFSGGGNRTLEFEHDVLFGVVEVKVDSGAWVRADNGYTKVVTTGQTVYIKYSCFGVDESATLTVTDSTLAELLDTLTLSFDFNG